MLRARYRRIIFFFARVIIGLIIWEVIYPRLGLRNRVSQSRPKRLRRYAASFRKMAVRMGGVMIKVGQFLSSRVDVLPPEIIEELKGLQDEVPAESFAKIRAVAEAELGDSLQSRYAAFEEIPLAAASLGQVHRARLHKPTRNAIQAYPDSGYNSEFWGVNVVVKVQRPNIENIVATDMAALRTVGKWLNRYRPIRRRANVPALLNEFSNILYEELDYLAEGRNAETFALNFRTHPGVRVPRVVWQNTTKRVLTLENVWAIKIADFETISKAGIDRAEVASRLLDTYLQQIFEDGFFHADPHPGNLFITPIIARDAAGNERVARWELTFVDFGMVGRLPDTLRSGLREMLIAVGTRDSTRMVKSFQDMELLLPSADLQLLEKAISREFELFWGKSMSELNAISFDEIRDFTDEFRDLLYEMPFQVPQNAVFLARCVGILAGMCTGLDPEFNIWDHLAPYAQKMMADEIRAGPQVWLGEVEKLARTFLAMPSQVSTILSKMERGELVAHDPALNQEVKRLQGGLNKLTGGVVFAALLMGGIQLYLGGQEIFGLVLISGSGLDLLWLLFSRPGRNA